MAKVKLGELQVDRRVWAREKLNLDQIRCMVNDLVNGDELPPLVVEQNTKTVVGGNHRYKAYERFYGGGWEQREVEVAWIDLPPFEEDPEAWKIAAMKDNEHYAERLKTGDRNRLAVEFMKAGLDTQTEEMVMKLLHYTPETWNEFKRTYMENVNKTIKKKILDGTNNVAIANDKKVTQTMQAIGAPFKAVRDDIQPHDAKISTIRSRLQARVNALLGVLDEVTPGMITSTERDMLGDLMLRVEVLLQAEVA